MLSQDLVVKGVFYFQELLGKCSSCALRFDVDKEVNKSLCVILSKLPTSFVTHPSQQFWFIFSCILSYS
jgi:hypothetical protein